MPSLLPINEPLCRRSRLAGELPSGAAAGPLELAVLAGCGLAAALMSGLLDFGLRIPGHAVLRAVLPLSLGMALVPRRGAGLTMGMTAAAGAWGLSLAPGKGIGLGAATSLILLGPLLDGAVAKSRPGWRLCVAFGAAGLTANLAAFAVRGGAKMSGGAAAGLRPLHDWLSVAPFSYAACGLAAGILSAWIWFRMGDPSQAAASGGSGP